MLLLITTGFEKYRDELNIKNDFCKVRDINCNLN